MQDLGAFPNAPVTCFQEGFGCWRRPICGGPTWPAGPSLALEPQEAGTLSGGPTGPGAAGWESTGVRPQRQGELGCGAPARQEGGQRSVGPGAGGSVFADFPLPGNGYASAAKLLLQPQVKQGETQIFCLTARKNSLRPDWAFSAKNKNGSTFSGTTWALPHPEARRNATKILTQTSVAAPPENVGFVYICGNRTVPPSLRRFFSCALRRKSFVEVFLQPKRTYLGR